MKVVFKVCCAPETDSQNVTLSSENGHTNNDSKVNQVSHQNGVKLNQYPQNNRGTSINTDTQSLNNDGRVPTLTINTSNGGGNFVQSTMTWLSRNGDGYGGGGGGGGGNYPHSTPITSTVSVQQYYPHPTSSRPFINSAINNKNNKNNNIYNKNNSNNNYNHSNYAPSHKPTKKTSKKICIFPVDTITIFLYQCNTHIDENISITFCFHISDVRAYRTHPYMYIYISWHIIFASVIFVSPNTSHQYCIYPNSSRFYFSASSSCSSSSSFIR